LSIRIFLGVSIIVEQGRFCPPAETGLSIFRITGVDGNGDMTGVEVLAGVDVCERIYMSGL
jgi:hypothetical protein